MQNNLCQLQYEQYTFLYNSGDTQLYWNVGRICELYLKYPFKWSGMEIKKGANIFEHVKPYKNSWTEAGGCFRALFCSSLLLLFCKHVWISWGSKISPEVEALKNHCYKIFFRCMLQRRAVGAPWYCLHVVSPPFTYYRYTAPSVFMLALIPLHKLIPAFYILLFNVHSTVPSLALRIIPAGSRNGVEVILRWYCLR